MVKKEHWHLDYYYTWRDDNKEGFKMSLKAPPHLMAEARKFFNIEVHE